MLQAESAKSITLNTMYINVITITNPSIASLNLLLKIFIKFIIEDTRDYVSPVPPDVIDTAEEVASINKGLPFV